MDPQAPLKLPTNRSFGLMFVVLMSGLSIWEYYRQGPFAYWWATAAALLLLITQFVPSLLTPLNRLWMGTGLVLGKIVSPVVMGLMYFVLIAPVGVATRIARRDPLRLSFDRAAHSYWIERTPPGPTQKSFENQF